MCSIVTQQGTFFSPGPHLLLRATCQCWAEPEAKVDSANNVNITTSDSRPVSTNSHTPLYVFKGAFHSGEKCGLERHIQPLSLRRPCSLAPNNPYMVTSFHIPSSPCRYLKATERRSIAPYLNLGSVVVCVIKQQICEAPRFWRVLPHTGSVCVNWLEELWMPFPSVAVSVGIHANVLLHSRKAWNHFIKCTYWQRDFCWGKELKRDRKNNNTATFFWYVLFTSGSCNKMFWGFFAFLKTLGPHWDNWYLTLVPFY